MADAFQNIDLEQINKDVEKKVKGILDNLDLESIDQRVKENIQPSVNMTYHEFRAKMPPQVDDEIVQLIYYNQDAFADFAQIKTQDEVYAFNNKWGVSLVLPFDTEIA